MADITQDSFNEANRFSKVIFQRGRDVRDSELNEFQDIVRVQLYRGLANAIQKTTGGTLNPGSNDNGWLVVGTGAANQVNIDAGDLFCDGIDINNPTLFTFSGFSTPLLDRTDTVYLAITEVEVTDPSLTPQLGETTRRRQIQITVNVSTTGHAGVPPNTVAEIFQGGIHYFMIADVARHAGIATINFGDVTDLRHLLPPSLIILLQTTLNNFIANLASTAPGEGGELVGWEGGNAWADGTTNPATTVTDQLQKIIDDLGQGVGGTAKISSDAIAGATYSLIAEDLFLQLTQIVADLNAIQAYIDQSPNIQVITSSNPAVVIPAFAKVVTILVRGAGGGGSGYSAGHNAAGGGASGFEIEIDYPASALDPTVAVVIGAGGTGGTTNVDGGTGGTTTVTWSNAELLAIGGHGGSASAGTGGNGYSGGGGGADSLHGGGPAGAGGTAGQNGVSANYAGGSGLAVANNGAGASGIGGPGGVPTGVGYACGGGGGGGLWLNGAPSGGNGTGGIGNASAGQGGKGYGAGGGGAGFAVDAMLVTYPGVGAAGADGVVVIIARR